LNPTTTLGMNYIYSPSWVLEITNNFSIRIGKRDLYPKEEILQTHAIKGILL
jgi:hypothetical protein